MTNQHPITPPPELVRQWYLGAKAYPPDQWVTDVATQAAQWAADTQLQMDADWVTMQTSNQMSAERLKAEMRPKPPSLKEQALAALHAVATGANDTREQHQDLDTIRKALEALPND